MKLKIGAGFFLSNSRMNINFWFVFCLFLQRFAYPESQPDALLTPSPMPISWPLLHSPCIATSYWASTSPKVSSRDPHGVLLPTCIATLRSRLHKAKLCPRLKLHLPNCGVTSVYTDQLQNGREDCQRFNLHRKTSYFVFNTSPQLTRSVKNNFPFFFILQEASLHVKSASWVTPESYELNLIRKIRLLERAIFAQIGKRKQKYKYEWSKWNIKKKIYWKNELKILNSSEKSSRDKNRNCTTDSP